MLLCHEREPKSFEELTTVKGKLKRLFNQLATAYLWQNFITLRLKKIKRVGRVSVNHDEWAKMLLRIGEGTEASDDEGFITFQNKVKIVNYENELVESILGHVMSESRILISIITTKNEKRDSINEVCLSKLPTESRVYVSYDANC